MYHTLIINLYLLLLYFLSFLNEFLCSKVMGQFQNCSLETSKLLSTVVTVPSFYLFHKLFGINYFLVSYHIHNVYVFTRIIKYKQNRLKLVIQKM